MNSGSVRTGRGLALGLATDPAIVVVVAVVIVVADVVDAIVAIVVNGRRRIVVPSSSPAYSRLRESFTSSVV